MSYYNKHWKSKLTKYSIRTFVTTAVIYMTSLILTNMFGQSSFQYEIKLTESIIGALTLPICTISLIGIVISESRFLQASIIIRAILVGFFTISAIILLKTFIALSIAPLISDLYNKDFITLETSVKSIELTSYKPGKYTSSIVKLTFEELGESEYKCVGLPANIQEGSKVKVTLLPRSKKVVSIERESFEELGDKPTL
jgi:hypothetical protein